MDNAAAVSESDAARHPGTDRHIPTKHMSKLLDEWMVAAKDLGLEIIAPFDVDLSDGVRLKADFLVKNFGGSSGTLVVTSYENVEPHVQRLQSLGYGFSVLDEPKDERNQAYCREGMIDVLSDWGWTGPKANRPHWLKDLD